MYIEKLQIHKYRVLEDMEIRFQPPQGETADPETGNVVNVIAGVNGSGKTTLLRLVYGYFESPCECAKSNKYADITLKSIEEIKKKALLSKAYTSSGMYIYECQQHQDIVEYLISLSNQRQVEKLPSIIFVPAYLGFEYKYKSFLQVNYQFLRNIDPFDLLGNAEAYIKEFIFNKERTSTEADPKKRSDFAVAEFNKTFLDANLLTRLVDLDAAQMNRPVFANPKGELVTIDQLSDGEKQLYGRVIALMMLEPQESIIIIDEPEIALHPAWQQKIMQLYSRIGKNNQFIVATHSPQIIANTPYQNLVLLRKNEQNKIHVVYPSQPPTGVDINSVLTEIMGVEELLPPDVLGLRRKYREHVKQGTEDSEDAKEIKNQLLQRENNNSQFMQEMRLLQRLRGVK